MSSCSFCLTSWAAVSSVLLGSQNHCTCCWGRSAVSARAKPARLPWAPGCSDRRGPHLGHALSAAIVANSPAARPRTREAKGGPHLAPLNPAGTCWAASSLRGEGCAFQIDGRDVNEVFKTPIALDWVNTATRFLFCPLSLLSPGEVPVQRGADPAELGVSGTACACFLPRPLVIRMRVGVFDPEETNLQRFQNCGAELPFFHALFGGLPAPEFRLHPRLPRPRRGAP